MFKKPQGRPFTFLGTMRLTEDFKKIRKIFSSCWYCRREYLTLLSPFAVFEPVFYGADLGRSRLVPHLNENTGSSPCCTGVCSTNQLLAHGYQTSSVHCCIHWLCWFQMLENLILHNDEQHCSCILFLVSGVPVEK